MNLKLLRRAAAFTGALGFLMPAMQAFADEGHTEEQASASLGSYVLLAFALLLVAAWIVYFLQKKRLNELKNAKKPGDRERRRQVESKVSAFKWAWILSLLGLIVTGTVNVVSSLNEGKGPNMEHIHGMGYSPDGHKLLFAAHDGLKIYSHDGWTSGTGEKHDFMGFTVMDQGFYSSGHPAPGSKLKNPFGVVRSTDEGKTLETLAYYGQIDFHLLTAGYKSHAIYIFNPEPSAALKEAGLYVSADEGKNWAKSEMKGVTGEPGALAAHPDDASMVAVGTAKGLYLSKDSGKTFEAVLTGKQITGLFFSPKGLLYAGTYSGTASGLLEIKPGTKESKELTIPHLEKDAAAYIAVNPTSEKEIAFVTFNREVYVSGDQGGTWKQIVDKGKGL